MLERAAAMPKKLTAKHIIESDDYVTMTTIEIAEMTGKEHYNVLKDVRHMLEDLQVEEAPVTKHGTLTYLNTIYKKGKGFRSVPMIVLNEHYTMVLLTGYSVHLRDAVIKELLARREAMKQAKNLRDELRTGYAPMTRAIAEVKIDPKHYHFSNEANMINRIVTGMNAKQYRETHGVDSVRDHLSASERELMEELQQMNTSLLKLGFEYQDRKARLTEYVNSKKLEG